MRICELIESGRFTLLDTVWQNIGSTALSNGEIFEIAACDAGYIILFHEAQNNYIYVTQNDFKKYFSCVDNEPPRKLKAKWAV